MSPALDDLVHLTPDLASLGWTDDHEAWALSVIDNLDDPQSRATVHRGRVAQVSRGFSLVFTGGDALLAASGATRTRTDMAPATGDFVVVADDPEHGRHIVDIAPRSSALSRRAAGRVPEPQVLAANLDHVFVMSGLDRDVNVRRIERQLVVAWDSGATPAVLLTKADLLDAPENDGDLDAIVDRVQRAAPGVEVIAVSMLSDHGIADITRRLGPASTVALLGLSGIGKSTLVNLLSGGEVQRTGEVRAADRRGRHTTVTRDLIPIPGHGFVIDTPGIREIGLWQAYDGLALTFPEIHAAAAECRFADCSHDQEPGCGVQAALASGRIEPRRLQHWQELSAELELQETQLEEFARRSESRDRADAERDRDNERKRKPGRGGGRGRSRGDRGRGGRRGRRG